MIPLRYTIPLLCALCGFIVALGTLLITYQAGLNAMRDNADKFAASQSSNILHRLSDELGFAASAVLAMRASFAESPLPSDTDPKWYVDHTRVVKHTFLTAWPSVYSVGAWVGDGNVIRAGPVSGTDDVFFVVVRDLAAIVEQGQFYSNGSDVFPMKENPLIGDNPPSPLAVMKQASGWTKITVSVYPPHKLISAAVALVSNASGTFLGAVYCSQTLDTFANAIAEIVSPLSHVFVVDQEEALVAASPQHSVGPSVTNDTDPNATLAPGCTRSHSLILCRHVMSNYPYGPLAALSGQIANYSQRTRIKVGNEQYVLSIQRITTDLEVELNLTVIVIIPEKEVVHDIVVARNVGIVISVLVVLATIVICGSISYWLLSPLKELAVVLADGGSTEDSKLSGLQEIRALQESLKAFKGELVQLQSFVPNTVMADNAENKLNLETLQQPQNVFHPRECTILFFEAFNLPTLDLPALNKEVECMLSAVVPAIQQAKGVVDIMAPPIIVASFNAHTTCVAHQKCALLCAMEISRLVNAACPTLLYAIAIDSGNNSVGNCGSADRSARVVMENAWISFASSRCCRSVTLGTTSFAQKRATWSGDYDFAPLDTVHPLWEQKDRHSNVTLFQAIPRPPPEKQALRTELLRTLKKAYSFLIAGSVEQASVHLQRAIDDSALASVFDWLRTIAAHLSEQHSAHAVRREWTLWEGCPWDFPLPIQNEHASRGKSNSSSGLIASDPAHDEKKPDGTVLITDTAKNEWKRAQRPFEKSSSVYLGLGPRGHVAALKLLKRDKQTVVTPELMLSFDFYKVRDDNIVSYEGFFQHPGFYCGNNGVHGWGFAARSSWCIRPASSAKRPTLHEADSSRSNISSFKRHHTLQRQTIKYSARSRWSVQAQ